MTQQTQKTELQLKWEEHYFYWCKKRHLENNFNFSSQMALFLEDVWNRSNAFKTTEELEADYAER